MKITIEISDIVQQAFLENLRVENVTTNLLEKVIEGYLNSSIDRGDIYMQACMYLDTIESSGELEDIIYESTLE